MTIVTNNLGSDSTSPTIPKFAFSNSQTQMKTGTTTGQKVRTHFFYPFKDPRSYSIVPEPEAILLGGTIPRVATPLSSATVPTFALGLQKGLFLLKLSPDGGEDDLYRLGTMPERASRSSRSSPSAADDVWAADFLTPNTVVAGGRGKFVFVADSRVEAEGALACEHGALITDIKAIDDYRILVGGGSRAPGGNEVSDSSFVTIV